MVDALIFGRRLRHLRRERGWTLDDLGGRVGKPAPYLSTIETGKREPKLSLIGDLAEALGVPTAELLDPEPPSRRARLEVAVERAQQDPLYAELRLPYLKPSARVPDTALEHVVGLYDELRRRSTVHAATPEEARRANAELRREMQEQGNYFADVERAARDAMAAVEVADTTALSQGSVTALAAHFGFAIKQVSDLPAGVRSVTDRRHGRIYIPQRDSLRTREARSVVVQTLGHFALAHPDPTDFAEFLRQRVEANYFAGAVLAPERAAVPFLTEARRRGDISVEDLKEVFYISYQMAAHRFTNLATEHLGLRVHFVRSDGQGTIWKAYENNGVPFPAGPDGAVEGQRLCREWGTRQVFRSEDKFALHYQYTDTPAGPFWCVTHVEADRAPNHAVTVGVRTEDATAFRGHDTDRHSTSRCPDGECCRVPPADLRERWSGAMWASPNAHSHVLAVTPAGPFPGIDQAEVYEFLDEHA